MVSLCERGVGEVVELGVALTIEGLDALLFGVHLLLVMFAEFAIGDEVGFFPEGFEMTTAFFTTDFF